MGAPAVVRDGCPHCGEGWVPPPPSPARPTVLGPPVAGRDVSLAPARGLQLLLPALLQLSPGAGLRAPPSPSQACSTMQTMAGITAVPLHQPHTRGWTLLASLAGTFPR